ncbi:MAG: type II toxin-antitoxin system HicA family toxin [Ignavibacteriales bacterium]|nr:type II toxin-antitoxin system HicA family toxin [Ignavibacteriales bacterium]
MPEKFPPLTPQEVVAILKARGFSLNNQEGSHAQYVGFFGGVKRRVTVDMAKVDYNDFLIKSMIRQSGMTREEFYCSTKSTARKINKKKLEFTPETAPAE